MSSIKTPQEKKRLAYQRDGQIRYGQSDKASRRHIPLHKRHTVRAARHAAKQALREDVISGDRDAPREAQARRKGARPSWWRKCPDTPLGAVVEHKLERRAALGIMPATVALEKLGRVRAALRR
jgi:hypothetical protein